jgi:hypothetical protein
MSRAEEVRDNAMEKFDSTFTYDSEHISSPLTEVTSRSTKAPRKLAHVHKPWRHSVSHHLFSSTAATSSPTVRHFQPARQRKRLFFAAFMQWLVTVIFCVALALLLWGFSQLLVMRVWQVKLFNALVILASMWLGNNLQGSLREYAMMMRWRILAMKYRSLHEVDLILQCESLRSVFKLFFVARRQNGWGFSRTQIGCVLWLGINLALAVLVALLGLTYNIGSSSYPELHYGLMSSANLSIIRDVWGAEDPTFYAQLGAANGFGIQGQDYNFTQSEVPGQGSITVYGTPMTPNIYDFDYADWYGNNNTKLNYRYYFMDLNVDNTDISILTKRNIGAQSSCQQYQVLSGGNGLSPYVTFLDADNQPKTLNTVRVGPGAVTYIGLLNSTCGPRCTELYVLQSVDNETITSPAFFKCNSTVTNVANIDQYVQSNQTHALYDLPDTQARIFAGAIGWSGFNFTDADNYQYVRYPIDSYWSPNGPVNETDVAALIMEFAIEAIAALDNNGPRMIVAGWYPVPSQCVQVIWKWAITLLAVIPGLHALAMVGVVWWAGEVVIRDQSPLSVATLLRPLVARLGDHGCLLTGREIAEQGVLEGLRVKYGVEREDGADDEVREGLRFENQIVGSERVRHVGMLEQRAEDMDEGVGRRRVSMKDRFPAGLYDGSGIVAGNLLARRRVLQVSRGPVRVLMLRRKRRKEHSD